MVEKPRSDLYYGSWVAGPIVVEVMRRMFEIEATPEIAKYKKR